MSQRQRLRPLPRISYQELEEPSFDEYIYCEKCGDYVYEYCSIHGPLLVIPDEKVSQRPTNPLNVPRSALTIPNAFLHLNHSNIPGAGLGVFATLTLPNGVRFGPYRGKRTQQADSAYCWQIYDGNKKPLCVIDGGDITHSNWMRYVNCARHCQEQNLVAYQYQGDIYYRTIKIIPRSTELLVFYGSEYADSLQIDLRKYNSKSDYLDDIGIHTPKLNYYSKAMTEENNEEVFQEPAFEEVTTTTVEITRTDADFLNPKIKESKDYEILNDFMYIDDICNTEDQPKVDNDQYKVGFDSEKQCFEIEFQTQISDDILTGINENKRQVSHNSKVITDKTYSDKMVQVDLNAEDTQPDNNVPIVTSSTKKQRLDEFNDSKFEKKNETDMADYKKNFTKIVTDKVTWQCNDCQKILSSKTSLYRHFLIHDEVKQFKCSECEYATNFEHRLAGHMPLHTGIYEHKCERCTFATNLKKNLLKHVKRVHILNRDQQFCELCGYKVNSKTVMENHVALHGVKNVYKCDVCNYLCKKSRYLKRHVMEVHDKPIK